MTTNNFYIIVNEKLQYLYRIDSTMVKWNNDVTQCWTGEHIIEHFDKKLSKYKFYDVINDRTRHHYKMKRVLGWLVIPASIDGNGRIEPDYRYYTTLGNFLKQ